MSRTCYSRLMFTNEQDAKKIFSEYFTENDPNNEGKKQLDATAFFGEEFENLDPYDKASVMGARTPLHNAYVGEPWKEHAFYNPAYTHEIHAQAINGDCRQVLFQIMSEHPDMQICASVRDHGSENEVAVEQVPTNDPNKVVTYKDQYLGGFDPDDCVEIPAEEKINWSISTDDFKEVIKKTWDKTVEMRTNVIRAEKAAKSLDSFKPAETSMSAEKSLGE